MSKGYSAQGSITIKRLRSGDTLYISFDTNGKPLYQGVDTTTGKVTPDWTVAGNQPVRIPNIKTIKGQTVSVSNHQWKHNGVVLTFNGDTDGDYVKDSTGKFEMNPNNGAIKIIANLASKTNYANDSLEYSCVATLAGVEYNLSKSTDIIIQSVGASSYNGMVWAITEQLTGSVTSTKIYSQLILAGSNISSYVKWYKNSVTTNNAWTDKNGKSEIDVTRDDVNGTTLFIAEFYLTSTDTTPVFRAACRIKDAADDFQIVYYISSDNKTVDKGKDVEVTGKIVNMRTNSEVTASSASWKTYVMDKKNWTPTQTVSSNVVTVTTADTDTDAGENDVEVTGEVNWDE